MNPSTVPKHNNPPALDCFAGAAQEPYSPLAIWASMSLKTAAASSFTVKAHYNRLLRLKRQRAPALCLGSPNYPQLPLLILLQVDGNGLKALLGRTRAPSYNQPLFGCFARNRGVSALLLVP